MTYSDLLMIKIKLKCQTQSHFIRKIQLEKNVKKINTWRLNNTLLNNQEIAEEIKQEIKKYLEIIHNVCKLREGMDFGMV